MATVAATDDTSLTTFAREVWRLEPGFSVGAYAGDQPYRDRETIDPMTNAWLAAELPP